MSLARARHSRQAVFRWCQTALLQQNPCLVADPGHGCFSCGKCLQGSVMGVIC